MEDVSLSGLLENLGTSAAAVAAVYYLFTKKIDSVLKIALDEWRSVRATQESQVDRLLKLLEKSGGEVK